MNDAPVQGGRRRLGLLILVGIAFAIGAAGLYGSRERPAEEAGREQASRMMSELMSGKVPIGGPFTLVDQLGKSTRLADFHGKLVLLYFGYTFCPDVCPTDLLAIAQTLAMLGAQGDRVQPVFVTLDPGRDTQQLLSNYVAAFDSRFVALRGSEDEIRRVATSYRIYYRKIESPRSGAYLIDHMAFVFLLDQEGRYVAFFPPGTSAQRMSVMVREYLARSR